MTNKELLIAALRRLVDDVMVSAGGKVSADALDQAREALAAIDMPNKRPGYKSKLKRKQRQQQNAFLK
jgi:hypothetical protein